MELFELVWFGGRLLTCHDRTGVVYEVSGGRARPPHILADGGGHADHGYKCEWAAARHGLLHVGGLGRAWTDKSGGGASDPPLWVKLIEPGGAVRHLNWSAPFSAMRAAAGGGGAGYLRHEAAVWDNATYRWLFLPRRASTEAWSHAADEEPGAHLIKLVYCVAVVDHAVVDHAACVPVHPTPVLDHISVKLAVPYLGTACSYYTLCALRRSIRTV